ncbi:MAG: DegV family protein, partial [Desulfobacterales bacterium]
EGYMSIMHTEVPDQAQTLSAYFQDRLDIPPPDISYLPPAIITHAGPGAVAVSFFQGRPE